MKLTTNTTITDWAKWIAADRPHVFWGRHPKLRSTRAYLRGLKSGHYRGLVLSALVKQCGGHPGKMNRQIRCRLHDSLFQVMDQVESKKGGQSDHPTVRQLNIALNLVDDDLDWNDEAGSTANKIITGSRQDEGGGDD